MQSVNEYIRIPFVEHDLEELNTFGAYGWRPVLNIGRWLILERPVPEEQWAFVREFYAKRSPSKNLDGKQSENVSPVTNS